MKKLIILFVLFISIITVKAESDLTIYLNPATGNDGNNGTKDAPLRTLPAAADLVNENSGSGAVTIVLAPGIYSIDRTAVLVRKTEVLQKRIALLL